MMDRKSRTKYLLITAVFMTLTLLSVALFSLYFSDKTVSIKAQELQMAQQYRALQQKVAQKEEEFHRLCDNIDELKTQIGPESSDRHADVDKILKICTPKIRKLLLESVPLGYPSTARRISSPFGFRMHPIYHEERFHHGIDFAGKVGTPVYATADGIVEYAGFSKGGYGNLVMLTHNYGFRTLYGHMLSDLKVRSGDFVKRGEVIGYLGNTGLSTGPHLHYEIKYLRNTIDPAPFLHADMQHFDALIRNGDRVAWGTVLDAITDSYRKFTSL